MPLLLLTASASLAAAAIIVVAGRVLIGWVRQDRVLRRMQREIAERASLTGRGGSSR